MKRNTHGLLDARQILRKLDRLTIQFIKKFVAHINYKDEKGD